MFKRQGLPRARDWRISPSVEHIRPKSTTALKYTYKNLMIAVTLEQHANMSFMTRMRLKYLMRAELVIFRAQDGADRPTSRGYRPSLILDILVPFARAQDMHANLEEVYPRWVERHGVRRAELIRACQVTWLIAGAWWEKALTTGERLLKVIRIVGS